MPAAGALTLDPKNMNTLVGWSQFRLADRDLSGAWEWIEKALAQKPDDAEAVNMKGILLHTEDRFEEAVEAFLKAESLGCLSASSNRGNSLMDLGRFAESLDAHRTSVARDPIGAGAACRISPSPSCASATGSKDGRAMRLACVFGKCCAHR